ncbi:MliC family protein [Mesorhizobium sp. ANAO-SY3R2]|uniref:MliC family protein n=1 Tax=Mesorhizobium sp. ANAO-SY3R2 TaxID=3166644 RepID=UPI0036702B68
MRPILTALILAAAVNRAAATTVTLELPGDAPVDRQTVTYKCDGPAVKAEYVNAGENSLVILTFDDRTVVAVTVLSASGARYAGRQYVWWTKGDNADLYDLTRGEDAPPVFSCTASR